MKARQLKRAGKNRRFLYDPSPFSQTVFLSGTGASIPENRGKIKGKAGNLQRVYKWT